MLKPIVDSSDQCGQPNGLVTLSKHFGQSNSRIASGVERSVQKAIPGNGQGTLLAQEYLAHLAEHTAAPDTFDMRKLMAKLPKNGQGMEEGWNEAQQRSLDNWSDQFLQNFHQQREGGALGQKWAREFEVQKNDPGTMERAWQTEQSASTWAKDFLDRYDSSSSSATSIQQPLLAKDNLMAKEWEQEFMKQIAEWSGGQNHPGQGMAGFFDYESAWEAIHSREAQERFGFTQENPFVGEENPVERAREAFGEGRVADSILHFEAALQQEPRNVEIWYSLGMALAENEDDPRAISALCNALKLDPQHKNALLGLTVSLANESFDHVALHELHKWICVHGGSEMPEDTAENTATLYRQYVQLNRSELVKVEQQFLALARRSGPEADPELQNALWVISRTDQEMQRKMDELNSFRAVLYNLGRDYDRAVDCIQSALASRPEDPVLWNRLGATLANADRSAEAINAYKRALQLFPAYVRARYNLGIACMNLNSYRDAADHFVAALQIQNSPDQSQIWSKLRSALIRLDGPGGMTAECFDALEKRQLGKVEELLRRTH